MSNFGYVPMALRLLWKKGKESIPNGPVFISMNDYKVYRLADVPFVWWEGFRLRYYWPRTEGTLGLWFCTLPGRRSISVSIWRDPEDLKRFVHSARHVKIMHRYKDAGNLINTRWTADRFDRWLIWDQALDRLTSPRFPHH
ncbi:MAG TPA: hypothetical protein VE715_10265 [Blastocatellia bacterium]|nr:hypothetical protein [Blastocatellia bacterium]